MKKTVFYSLFTLCMAFCAISFTSCDDDEIVNCYYKVGLESSTINYPEGATDDQIKAIKEAFDADIEAIDNAFIETVKKTNPDYVTINSNIHFTGDSKEDCDAQAEAFFNQILQSVQLNPTWEGEFVYGLYFMDRVNTANVKIKLGEKKYVFPVPAE